MKRNSNQSGSGSSRDNIFSRFFTKLRTSMDNPNTITTNMQEKTSNSEIINNINNLDITSNNLPIFSEQLNNFIINIEEILNHVYAENREGHLRATLEKNVNELTQIRNEIKSTTDNINMLNKYIAAVKKDTDEFRKYLKRLTNEERRAKFSLKREKLNQANLRRSGIPLPESSTMAQAASNALYYPQTMIGPQMLNSSAGSSTGTTLQFNDDIIVKQTRIFNRSSNVTKRNKNNRFRKDLAITDGTNSSNTNNLNTTENGVTLFLRPIQDIPEVNSVIIDTNEEEDNATSAINLSWFSNGTTINSVNTNINNNISVTGSNNTSILESASRRLGRQTTTTHTTSAPNSIFTINSQTYEEVD